MSRVSLGASLGALVLAGTAAAQQSTDLLSLQANMALGLEVSQVQSLELHGVLGQPLLVDLEIAGMPATLDLTTDTVRAVDFRVIRMGPDGPEDVDPGPVRTYRGTVLEDPGSLVLAAWLDDGLHARLRLSSGDLYWLEPLVRHVPNAGLGDHVLYHNDDVLDQGYTCGIERLPNNDPKPPEEPPGTGFGTGLSICEIGIDSDKNYFNKFGTINGTIGHIEKVIFGLTPQYENETGITYRITKIIIRDVSNGPYTSNDPSILLSQFRTHWNSTKKKVRRDIAHLFTGKNLQGSVIGIAFVGVICNKNSGYGLVQHISGFGCQTDLSAHEIGHNWNALHCGCGNFTMNASLTCANNFHDNITVPVIVGFRNSRTCLDDQIWTDSFESGDFASGGWTCAPANRCKINRKAGYVGKWGAQLNKTAAMERAVSTEGFNDIHVLFAARSLKYESGEELTLEWFNGTTWMTAGSWDTKSWRIRDADLPPGANDNAAFAIRFSTNAVGKKERSRVDDVFVVAD